MRWLISDGRFTLVDSRTVIYYHDQPNFKKYLSGKGDLNENLLSIVLQVIRD